MNSLPRSEPVISGLSSVLGLLRIGLTEILDGGTEFLDVYMEKGLFC